MIFINLIGCNKTGKCSIENNSETIDGGTSFQSHSLLAAGTMDQSNFTNVSCQYSAYSYRKRLFYGSLGALLSTYICIVNCIIFVAFLRDKQARRVPGHVLIVGLMVSTDIIMGIVSLPGYLLYNLCGEWPLGKWACDVWITIDYISTNVSMVSVTAVAFDRFLATNFVFTHKRWMHRTNQIRLCVALWLITSVRNIIVFPMWANISSFRRDEPEGQCSHPLYNNFVMGLFQRTVALYIPVVLLVFFYGAVVFRILQSSPHLHHQNRRLLRNTHHGCAHKSIINDKSTNNSPATNERNTNNKRVTLSKNSVRAPTLANRISKSFRIVTCVIVSFLLANLPWHVIENMIATGTTSITKDDPIYILSWIMCYMNAFINPIFYPFMHIEYKRLMVRWLRGDCSGNSRRLRNMVKKDDILLPNIILSTTTAGDDQSSLLDQTTRTSSCQRRKAPPKVIEIVQYVTST